MNINRKTTANKVCKRAGYVQNLTFVLSTRKNHFFLFAIFLM